MNQAQIDNVIGKASMLMNEDYMAHLDNIALSKRGKAPKVNTPYIPKPTAASQAMYSQQLHEAQQAPKRQLSNSTLMESIAEMPLMSGDSFPSMYNYQPGASLINEQQQVANSYGAPQPQYNAPQPQYQPQYQQQTQYQPQQIGGIDYGMIKYLVNEAIKENLEAIKQSILNESASLRGVSMPGGNKIQFLDNKGNLYEGQLVMKKRKQ